MNRSNSDIAIYTDESLADGVSLMVYPHPGSGIRNIRAHQCFKVESNQNRNLYILYKDFLHVKDMVWQSHTCQLFQQYGDTKSQTCNDIVLRIRNFSAKN